MRCSGGAFLLLSLPLPQSDAMLGRQRAPPEHHLQVWSRFKTFARQGPVFHIDFEAAHDDPRLPRLMRAIKQVSGVAYCDVMPPREVPWFPQNIRDLDMTRDTLDGGTDLINKDHPGFNDEEYKRRRNSIVEVAGTYMYGDKIPRVDYSAAERQTWAAVYDKLKDCGRKWACKEYLEAMPRMEKYCGYAPDNIPQLQDISDYLQQTRARGPAPKKPIR